jgi:hypothetical protein
MYHNPVPMPNFPSFIADEERFLSIEKAFEMPQRLALERSRRTVARF